jgi:hypothetical protein
VVFGVLYHSFHVATAHEFGDHVGLVLFLTQVKNGNNVGVGAQPAHGLGLTLDTGAGGFVQTVGLDQGERDFTVQGCVVGQVDFLLAALAQEPLDMVAAVGEG